MEEVGIFYGHSVYVHIYGHLVYFMETWYIWGPSAIFFPFVYICCVKKNLATLPEISAARQNGEEEKKIQSVK
jgi:hypothetical protein